MGVPFTAGQRVLASDLNLATQQGAWTAYSPSWSSSGTAPAIGNGTMVGSYAKVGRLVTARIMLNSGSTTTFGTGYYSWTLPLTAAVTGIPSGQFAHCGSMVISTSGSATFYTAEAFIAQSTPTVTNAVVNNNGQFVGAAVPAAFSGSGVQFQITITYESTS